MKRAPDLVGVTGQIAKDSLIKAHKSAKKYHDRTSAEPTFDIGDKVWLDIRAVDPGLSRKLSPDFVGP